MNGRAAYVRATPTDLHRPPKGECPIGACETPTRPKTVRASAIAPARDWLWSERWPEEQKDPRRSASGRLAEHGHRANQASEIDAVADAKQNETDAPRSPKKENRGARGDGVLKIGRASCRGSMYVIGRGGSMRTGAAETRP